MSTATTTFDLPRLRAETPGCAEVRHLNNAGAALMAAPVLAAIRGHLELEERLGGYEAADVAAPDIARAYVDLGRLLGAPARRIALAESATVAFAQALSAVPFEAGDVLLTTRADYVSNHIMYLSLARRQGIEVVVAPDAPEGGVDVGALAALIRQRRPRLVSVTHIPTYSGLVQPVETIGRLCRDHDVLYLVDACQTVGQLPVDVEALGCDFLTATSRKFLRGPRGLGFLYLSQRVLDAGLTPLLPDLRGARWTAEDAFEPAADARRFETWEFSYALVLGLGAAARYTLDLGIDAIARHGRVLARHARRRLAEVPGVRLLDRGPELCSIITLELPGLEAAETVAELRRRRLHVSASQRSSALLEFQQQGLDWALRVSPHYYNTEAEIDALAAALTELTSPDGD